MTCCTCTTCQTDHSHVQIVMEMDVDMENNDSNKSERLQAAGCRALAECAGSLLTALGSLLESHPDLHAELSPQCGQLLVSLGKKLQKASLQAG